jgi:metal-sulfur cluster biosynthetic enzyme
MCSDADVRAALATVVDPCSIATGVPVSLADMGLLRDVAVQDGDVTVTLILTSPICWQAGLIVEAVEAAVRALAGVRSVRCTVDHDAEWLPTAMAPAARRRLRALRPISEVAA